MWTELVSSSCWWAFVGVGTRPLVGQSWGLAPGRGKRCLSVRINAKTGYDVHQPSYGMVSGDSEGVKAARA